MLGIAGFAGNGQSERNAELWARPGDEVLRDVIASYQTHVSP